MKAWSCMTGNQVDRARQWEETERWLSRVDQDLAAVMALLRESLVDPAALHCQQAAEKLAKAFIVAMGASPPKTHDIEELAEIATDYNLEFGAKLRDLGSLTRWYLPVLYPVGSGEAEPSFPDVQQAHARIRVLRHAIEAFAPQPGK
jgi:HEPN domain-containing protein